jgi:glycosyltransferase involved in cell wall biosynthesis
LKIAAILPAYNEAERIVRVLQAVLDSPSVDEIIVVNDGSTDDTADVVRRVPHVHLVDLRANQGKGGAMAAGARATDADILLFLDADLIGLTTAHVESLLAPVRLRRAQMAVGRFVGGRRLTDLSQRVAPNISGQRVIHRDVFEQIPGIGRTRYGVEMAITRFCHYYRVPTETVSLRGVTHPMKEAKIGFFRGWASRSMMYAQILQIALDPRKPKRAKPQRSLPRFLRRMAANRRLNGHQDSTAYRLYRRERAWRRTKVTRTGKRGPL